MADDPGATYVTVFRGIPSTCNTPPPTVIPRAFFAEAVQDSNALGIKDTAPYFHNKGAKTLRDAVAQYQRCFNFTEAQDPVPALLGSARKER